MSWANGQGTFPLAFVLHFVLADAVAALFAGLIMSRIWGVTLTSSALRVHNLRRRTISWSSVQAIRIERFPG